VDAELDGLLLEDEGEGPVDDDAEAARPAGHLHEIDGSEEEPREETGDLDPEDAGDGGAAADGGEGAEGAEFEFLERFALQGVDDVTGGDGTLARRVLGGGGVGLAFSIGNERRVSDGPEVLEALDLGGLVADDIAALVQRESFDLLEKRAGVDAGAPDGGAGGEDFSAGEGDGVDFDFGESGLGVDLEAALFQVFPGELGEFGVDGGEDAVGVFHDYDLDLLGLDVAVVLGLGNEEFLVLTGEFDAGEVGTNDDDPKEGFPLFLVLEGVRDLEEADAAVSELDGVFERLQLEGELLEAGDGRHFGDRSGGEDEVIVMDRLERADASGSVVDLVVLGIDAVDLGHDEIGAFAEELSDGDRDVARFQLPHARFDEERIEEEEVVSVEDENLAVIGGLLREGLGGVGATEAPSDYGNSLSSSGKCAHLNSFDDVGRGRISGGPCPNGKLHRACHQRQPAQQLVCDLFGLYGSSDHPCPVWRVDRE